ncbi:MAG: hypothetical protein ACKV2T_40010 [Kofleriaceae bacterium]
MQHLLDRCRISITSRTPDLELARLHAVVEHKLLVDGRAELEEVLGALLSMQRESERAPPMPKTLDLIGHATPDSLLDLGRWVIDRRNPTVSAFFRELAEQDVLPRLGIGSLRLLGCGTATTSRARDTIVALSEILGMPVFGSTSVVHAGHFNADGFDPAWEFLLVGARDLGCPAPPAPSSQSNVRALDLDSLPAIPLIVHTTSWARHVVDVDVAQKVLSSIRRNEGAPMPGLLATPMCEIAIPSGRAGLFHVMQLMLDAQFVRVYPDDNGPGILYPVKDPSALLELIAS